MPDRPGDVHRIDPVSRSAARDPHLLDLHKVYVESDDDVYRPLEGPTVSHKLSVTVVRDEISDALRAVADWMEDHQEMFIDGIAVEHHYSKDGKEVSEVRVFVDFR